MAVPDYQSLMLPVLRLAATGIRRVPEVADAIADEFGLSAEDRAALLPRGRQRLLAWAIVGDESRPGGRTMEGRWATELRLACEQYDEAFFFKQWGGARPKSGGRLLEGEEWNGFPWQIVPKAIMAELA